MACVFKSDELHVRPTTRSCHVLTSRYSSVGRLFEERETVYVFVENGLAHGEKGGLIGRGVIVSAEPSEAEMQLDIEFDGAAVSTPLPTQSLRRFAHMPDYDLPELQQARISDFVPILQSIAEVVRKTTCQPIHAITDEAAAWLDVYHFEKNKRRD